MNKTYVYRKHLRHMPKVMIGLIVINLILFIIFLKVMIVMVPNIAIFLILDIFLLIFMRKFSTAKIVVTDEYFYFVNSSKELKWTYEEIETLEPKSIKNTGGWLNVVPKEGPPLKVTIVLEDISELVLDLKNNLDNKAMSDKYDEQKLFKFYKTAAYGDGSWRRMYYFVGRFLLLLLLQIIAVSIVVYITKSDAFVNTIFATVIITMITYIVIELGVFARKIGKDTSSSDWKLPQFDLVNEKRKMNIPLFVQGGLFVLSFLLLLL